MGVLVRDTKGKAFNWGDSLTISEVGLIIIMAEPGGMEADSS